MDCEITLNMGRKPTQNKKTYTCERCGCTFTSDIDEKIRLCYSCTADFVEWLTMSRLPDSLRRGIKW